MNCCHFELKNATPQRSISIPNFILNSMRSYINLTCQFFALSSAGRCMCFPNYCSWQPKSACWCYFSNHSSARAWPIKFPALKCFAGALYLSVTCCMRVCVLRSTGKMLHCVCVWITFPLTYSQCVCCYLNSDGCISRIFFSPGRRTKESTATEEEKKKYENSCGRLLDFWWARWVAQVEIDYTPTDWLTDWLKSKQAPYLVINPFIPGKL